MEHLNKKLLLKGLIILTLTGCGQEHPTLDDFVFENEIIEDTKDLLNDDPEKGIEIEKDATGNIVFSKNPIEETVERQISKDVTSSSTFKTIPSQLVPINDATPPSFDADKLGQHLIGKVTNTNEAEQSQALKAYANKLEELRDSYYERNLSKMVEWRNKNLVNLSSNKDEPLFYPFSGPDVVNMLTLFPNRKTYVMMGMEHVGTIDTVTQWQEPLTTDKMLQIQKAVESVFIRSFFRTLDMSTDFSRLGTKGVLPGMLLMLKLLNQQVECVQWVSLTDDGKLKYLTEAESKGSYTNFGIEVTIKHPTLNYSQKIYYFKTNLENSGLNNNPALNLFINKSLGTTTTLVKSASFLMHMAEFTTMQQSILDVSRMVLQDDSGIPFKRYSQKKWSYKLFGQYVGPYGDSFKAFNQPKLRKAYEAVPLELLDFYFGYGYAKIPAHLMIFIRK